MTDEITLSNEFTTVKVKPVSTRNGMLLEITSPKLGRTIRLDPIELESLTWQEKDIFSEFLSNPFGPLE